MFKEYKGLDLVGTGNEIARSWKSKDTFRKSLEMRKDAERFVFFEGPPSANGMPGIHHVMARSIKDAVCRYRSMKGFLVERKAGWDTHGLPVELGVEKMLGITKEDIGKKIPVAEYNSICRKEVMKYTREWVNLTERIGYWVDMDNPYVTYDNRYIETLWYLLKKIYDKGLLYKGYSIQPYSPAAGTGLSTHELNQPGCYRDVKDTTAVVQFKAIRDKASEKLYSLAGDTGVYFIAWTTTPWTLPSNTALCVGPDIEYVLVRSGNPYTGTEGAYVVARELLHSHFNGKIPFEVIGGPFSGKELEGISYEQLIPWFKPDKGAFRVITGDYVTTDEGTTGIVHIAPTFGADDAKVARLNGIPALMVKDRNGAMQAQVDRSGKMYRIEDLDPEYVAERVNTGLYRDFAGRFVKNAYDPEAGPDTPTLDVDICVMLKKENKAFKIEKHVHTYPHCWRTDKPVLYYPLDSWFIKTTAVQERMIELNRQIDWKPESTGSGRFGKWLENLQDWNLSRSRYWGTPLPVWRTEDGKEEKCIGSLKELYDEIEKSVTAGLMKANPLKEAGFIPGDFSRENYCKIDLHRPYVDEIVLASDSGSAMRRETDLIDVWFDSGAMPYAQQGLAGAGSRRFGETADFIAEGVDQTRGWFFTLHAISTIISDKAAFRRVISNGLVLDKEGNKMSKRLGNAVDPFRILDEYGPDPLRWYMLTNSQPWDNLKFDEAGVDEVRRKFFGTLYNTYSFFALYANVDNFTGKEGEIPAEERSETDRWLLSLLNTLVKNVTDCYENYDITNAGRLIQDFVCDNLSNWYVRLNRKRFWGGTMDRDKLAAYQTLYSALETVALLAAPIAPFYMERLFTDLNDATGRRKEESVHFANMPEYDARLIDRELEERMGIAQKCSSMVLALRRKVNIKVRQPLARMIIPILEQDFERKFESVKRIVLSEVNVKEVEYIKDTTGLITKKIKPNFKTLGKRYGKQMKEIASVMGSLDQKEISAIEAAGLSGADYTLALPSSEAILQPSDYEITSEDMPGWLVATEGKLTVALDITVTEELRNEGNARELINRIQNLRKDKGFEVTDKITAVIESRPDTDAAVSSFGEYIAAQTLAVEIRTDAGITDGDTIEWTEGESIKIEIRKK